jgi:hypothetical protein
MIEEAQGFNQVSILGDVSVKRRALKGRKKGLVRGAAFVEKDCAIRPFQICRPFRAGPV